MRTVKLITEQDVHPDDLVVVEGKLRINLDKLAEMVRQKGNETTQYVLEVVNPSATQIIQDANTNERKMVTINGMGVGIISLDFICRVNGNRTVAFRMPEGAPLPAQNITTNAGAGLLWWNKGEREIVFSQITNNQRIVLNLVGMFA